MESHHCPLISLHLWFLPVKMTKRKNTKLTAKLSFHQPWTSKKVKKKTKSCNISSFEVKKRAQLGLPDLSPYHREPESTFLWVCSDVWLGWWLRGNSWWVNADYNSEHSALTPPYGQKIIRCSQRSCHYYPEHVSHFVGRISTEMALPW